MRRIIGFLRQFSIRNRIAACLIAGLLVFSIIILVISRFFAQWIIKGYLYGYVESVQEEVVSSIEMVINEVTMLTVRLQVNQQIYDLFDDFTLSCEQRTAKLKQVVDEMSVRKEAIGDIIIVDFNNNTYSCYFDKLTIQIPDNLFIKKVENSQIPVWGDIKRDINNKAYIPIGVKYHNFYTGQNLGYLIIYIREDALFNIYKDIATDWGYSFIVSGKNYIISHPDKYQIGKVMLDPTGPQTENVFAYRNIQIDEQSVIIAVHKFSEYLKGIGGEWKIISIITYKNLFNVIYKVNKYLFVEGIIILILAVGISILISMKITRPVATLKKKLYDFGNGNLDVVLIDNKGDEIWDLEKSFNCMVVQIKELIEKNNEEKEKQREMELIALQAQINPHFLYNTLDAIGWIAKLKKQGDIERLVMALAKFFRLSLHKGDKFITVDEEIQLVQNFVTIEQMRMPGKFEISYNVQDEVRNYKILKIILQPVVENAIKHGIDKKRGKGSITVNVAMNSEVLTLQVIDDGAGFDINSPDFRKAYNSFQHSGYGLKNVEERIKLEYGAESGVLIKSEIGKGTVVELYLKIGQQLFG